MMTNQKGFKGTLRIIWAITRKDIVDGLKNRTTVSVIVIALLMVAFFRYVPSVMGEGSSSNLLIHDAGSFSLWTELEQRAESQVYGPYPTQSSMENDLIKGFVPELGIVLPADLDEQLEIGSDIVLEAYVMHWLGASKTAAIVEEAENLFSSVVGQPVRITIDGNMLYSQADQLGFGLICSLGLVIGILMVGMSFTPNLMFEEKQTRTLDALMTTPAQSSHVAVAKGLTGTFYCILVAMVGAAFYGSLVVHWGLFIVAILIGSFFSVGIGLLMGTVFEDRQQLMVWGFLLNFPLMLPLFLSWMRGLIPDAVLDVMQWIPTVALGKVFQVSFSDNTALSSFGLELALVVGCILVILITVVWALRRANRE
ncbi:MAG TPA: ABC transporter permease [Anaerolineae bacterium]|nr:ABC transporter permease [Anaerolineae bacterium]